MDHIKSAIVRVGKRVRAFDKLRDHKVKPSSLITPQRAIPRPSPKHTPEKPKGSNAHDQFKLTEELMVRSNPLLKAHEKKRFQEFLEPLKMENLKIFQENVKPYDKTLAIKNWKLKKSTNNLVMYQSFLDNQNLFGKMLDLLIELTPEQLMGERTEFSHLSILQAYEAYTKGLRYDTPKWYYHEIPKPDPQMSTSQFEEYIYFLTHTKILYMNSSSMNGIVNDILLYTHKLDNAQFKGKRTVKTYNNLIKFYGHDKNQSMFARTLLMVMEKDGILPNIDTINDLLKSVAITSHIRSNSNTFQLVIKYLKLAKFYKLPVNLLTWKRVYDCISNLYSKEMFLNKMSLINLPITKDMSYTIIDDYLKFITDPKELIKFIEKDINFDNWNRDDKIVNKVNRFKLVHSDNPRGLIDHQLMTNNDYSIKYIFEGIIKNIHLADDEKLKLLLEFYKPQDPGVIKTLLNQLDKVDYDIEGVNQVVNKLIYDFQKFSGTTNNEELIRHLTGSFNDLMSKFNYYKLPVTAKDLPICQLDISKQFQLPKRISNNMNYGRIKSINKAKLLNVNTTILQRLLDREMV